MANFKKASETKKGQAIVQFGIWNFHGIGQTRRDQHHRDEKGRSVYTPHTVDQFWVREHVVHSCGKKRMYLLNADGKSRGTEIMVHMEEDRFYGCFTATKAEALEMIQAMWESDPHRTATYEITDKYL